MATTPPTPDAQPIPIFLLKTKSLPSDFYEELLCSSTTPLGSSFSPVFVPVLEHRFDADGVARLKDLLVRRQIRRSAGNANAFYGGLIFTSQRAVEVFAKIVSDGQDGVPVEGTASWPYLQDVPIYSVGPATTRALREIPHSPLLQVFGDHTGNGEDLACFIREHYISLQDNPSSATQPLLFVVGEKRRDIIPKVLMGGDDADDGETRPSSAVPRIQVDEVVVYGTGVMPSFPDSLQRVLADTQDRPVRWAVVFSPTGCDRLLASLGVLDPETGRAIVFGADEDVGRSRRSTFIATIGPTTRTYLRNKFGFEPDVCADQPSPEGILRGILQFMETQSLAGRTL